MKKFLINLLKGMAIISVSMLGALVVILAIANFPKICAIVGFVSLSAIIGHSI